MKTIAASVGVKRLGQKEGRTMQVGNTRLTWKATGEDTGYALGLYQMDLNPGVGIPLHSHPYAEIFYVVSGQTDFARIDEQGKERWLRCGPGDTVVVPINALHTFHNRTDKPSRFLSSSVYHHQVALDQVGVPVDFDAPHPPAKEPTEAEANQYVGLMRDAMEFDMYFPQKDVSNGLEVFHDLESRNRQQPNELELG